MSEEYDWWLTPVDAEGHCVQDPNCIICGNGDPPPEQGGAIPANPDEDGHLPWEPA